MNLQLVTVALDPETGEFPAHPLSEIAGEVLSVVEHFFHHGGLPHLLLVVHHRPLDAEGRPGRKRPRIDPTTSLDVAERRVYEKLRTWRWGRAQADGVQVYVILNNRQLADIVRGRPKSLEDLRKIDGIGQKKVERYGKDLLTVIDNEIRRQAHGA